MSQDRKIDMFLANLWVITILYRKSILGEIQCNTQTVKRKSDCPSLVTQVINSWAGDLCDDSIHAEVLF